MKRLKTIEELDLLRKSIIENRDPDKTCVTICGGTGCSALGSDEVRKAFIEEIRKKGLEEKIDVKKTGCHGFCERGPVVVILPKEIFYQQMVPEDAPEVVSETLIKGNIVDRLLYVDPASGEKYVYDKENSSKIEDFQIREVLISKLRKRFETYGYKQIQTSVFEAYDVYANLSGTVNKDDMIKVIDSSESLSNTVKRFLIENPQVADRLNRKGKHRFFVSDVTEHMQGLATKILRSVGTLEHIKL